MKNPAQFKKNLLSDKSTELPIQVFGYQQNSIDALMHTLNKIISNFGEEAEVMLLGRNNFDINFIDDDLLQIEKITAGYHDLYGNTYMALQRNG
ncbi:hypothetical protein FHR92_003358 [Fontibacillus solani]|uniref:Uncharacterized protein n=1 Tax=Fontibacillus solani TaxID=1572857 RepID=A0A7W3SVG4_9BACL|nr:hypothetical protein [Fontibacillus solani]MBA9086878.1 hypothetical protein [Fontibacillus solani]